MNKKLVWVLFCIIMVACFALNSCLFVCNTCDGSGLCQYSPCSNGYVLWVDGFELCDYCGGSGKCRTCHGAGF
jgi:hypothetical protein